MILEKGVQVLTVKSILLWSGSKVYNFYIQLTAHGITGAFGGPAVSPVALALKPELVIIILNKMVEILVED